jgi:putative salt-induced outer membrane protein
MQRLGVRRERVEHTAAPESYIAAACGRLLLVVLLVPASAMAQAPPPPPPRFEGAAEASFIATSGNTETTTLGLGGELFYRPSPWVLKWKAALVRTETEDTVSAEAFAQLFRAERAISARLSWFGEYDYLRDEFAGIEHRNTISSGVSYILFRDARQQLNVDGGIGCTNEQRVTGDDISAALALAGTSYILKFSDTADLKDDFRFTTLFDDGDNWRAVNVAALTARLTQVLSLKVSHTFRMANQPPTGFEKVDTISAVAFVAQF